MAGQNSGKNTPLLHSQIELPPALRSAPTTSRLESYESLWICVNRICDRYLKAQSAREYRAVSKQKTK